MQPKVCNQRYATKGMQPKVCNQRYATKGMQPKVCNQRYATKGMQPKVCNQRYATKGSMQLKKAACNEMTIRGLAPHRWTLRNENTILYLAHPKLRFCSHPKLQFVYGTFAPCRTQRIFNDLLIESRLGI